MSNFNTLVSLSFRLGENKKTGEPQWQARGRNDGSTVLYVISEEAELVPSEDDPRWLCEILEPIHVSGDCNFRIVPVIPVRPNPSECQLLFVLGEHNGKSLWSSLHKNKDGSTTLFVVDRASKMNPSSDEPLWICDVPDYHAYQSPDGRFRIVPVILKVSVNIETRSLTFHEEIDTQGRERLASYFDWRGVHWTAYVDFNHADKVSDQLDRLWTCARDQLLFQSPSGMDRVVTVIPIAPTPVSERAQRRRERRSERIAAKQKEIDAGVRTAQERSATHQARNAERAAGVKRDKKKSVN